MGFPTKAAEEILMILPNFFLLKQSKDSRVIPIRGKMLLAKIGLEIFCSRFVKMLGQK